MSLRGYDTKTRTRRPLKSLTEGHRLFILNYVARPQNAKQAYLDAGFAPGGAKQNASALLRDPLVSAEIARLLGEKYKALHMDVDEILARAAMLARTDITAIIDKDGNVMPLHEIDEAQAVAIAGIDVEHKGDGRTVTKVRLRDPMPAIRLLAEHKKLVKNADEGVNALASAIAERLKLARERHRKAIATKE